MAIKFTAFIKRGERLVMPDGVLERTLQGFLDWAHQSVTSLLRRGLREMRAVTADTDVTIDDLGINADATSAVVTLTLPDPADVENFEFILRKSDASANNVEVAGTIDGVSGYSLTTQHQSVRVISDGSGWLTT